MSQLKDMRKGRDVVYEGKLVDPLKPMGTEVALLTFIIFLF